MAFFEQTGKWIMDAGQGLAQKKKNFSDVNRLNGAISGYEKKIAQLYASIGQTYYEQHREDAEPEQLPKIQEINGLLAEIARCKEELKQIKGIVKCPNCGAEVALTSNFCNVCGTKMPQEAKAASEAADETAAAPETRTCPSCHAPVEPGNEFCTHCGAKLETAAE